MKIIFKKLIVIIMVLIISMGFSLTFVLAETNNENVELTEQTQTEAPPGQEAEPQKGTITIHFLAEAGTSIAEKVVQEYDLGSHTIKAKNIEGYVLISPSTQQVTITEAGQKKEVSFQYKKEVAEPEPEPVEDTEPEPTPSPESILEPQYTVTGITLIAEPYKTIYAVGEEIDLDGIVIYADLSNGGEREVPVEELSVIGFNNEIPQETQVITIAYQGYTTQFAVTIEEREVETRGFISRILPILLALILILAIAAGTVFFVKRYQRSKKEPKPEKTGQGKLSRRNKIIIVVAVVLVFLMATGYLTALYYLGRMEREEIPVDDESLGIETGVGSKSITNIAVFGIDSEDGMRGRSDSMMIVTLDTKNDKIKITSIMRDSYVNISGRGMDKINHAYAFGGPELAIKTINTNFGLDIRHYVSVNFTSMPAIIDAVGGVELVVSDREAREIPGIDGGGTHVLDGQQALRFSRIRKIDSDFERSRRQRDIMESVIKAGFNTPMTAYPRMLNEVLPHLTTNLTSNQILSLGARAVLHNANNIEQVQFPPAHIAKGQLINGVYYYVFDLEEAARLLNQYIFEDTPIP